MKRICRTISWLAVALAIILLSGCGETAPIQGTVSLDGQPVENGSILFDPGESSQASKMVGHIQDGKYAIEADRPPQPGTYRVEIRWPKPTGKKIPAKDDPPNMIEEVKEAVPAKYNTDSELKVEITAGSNTHDFNLTSQ